MDDDGEEIVTAHADREKLCRLLEKYKNLSSDSPLSSATRCFSIDTSSENFVDELFEELENIDVGDLSREGTARNFANFLVELAETVPDVVIRNIDHLIPHLDDENYALRNAILTVLADLLRFLPPPPPAKEIKRPKREDDEDENENDEDEEEDDDEDQKEEDMRGKFLQHLEDHIHDKNAFVRSKALQLLTKLVGESESSWWLETTLPRAIGRITDKASTVRKAALQFLTVLLKANPDSSSAIRPVYEDEVIPRVSALLHAQHNNQQQQQQTSDVLEGVDFVVTCNELGIGNASRSFWGCCRLIWSKEQPVKDAIIRAFQRLFLSYNATDVRTKDEAIAKSLISLILQADVGLLTSLEEIVSELTKRRLISPAVCQIMWEHFAMRFPDGNTYEESKAALKLIGMMGKAEKSIIKDNMDILMEFGLGERAKDDFELASDAIYALEKLCIMPKAKAEEALRMVPFRLGDDHELFARLRTLIADGYVDRSSDRFWTPMTERAIRLLFAAADHPNVIAVDILRDVSAKFKSFVEPSLSNSKLLLRLLVLIGQVALQTFINLDVSVCRELKRRALLTDELRAKIKFEQQQERAKKSQQQQQLALVTPQRAKGGKTAKLLPIKTPRSKVSIVSNNAASAVVITPTMIMNAADDDDELNAMVGASADDEEYEFVSQLCEEDVLSDESILGKLSKIVIFVCQNPYKYREEDIQAAASLALSKLMLVSSKFAESNIQLFFTLLDRSEWPTVRANLVIAVGDLSFRFPNLIEPWTATVYHRLHDKDLNVRLNCLLVLNHLILNDMIKPKGFAANIAQCTLDGNIHVANLAKKFFAEYAAKGNALYNVLHDVISRLSDPDSCSFEDFKAILKFLFALIQKERQFEGLVEKLCQRFVVADTPQHLRRLSYCLTLVTYNERCLAKLQENVSSYGPKLGDGEVYADFITILNSAKKSSKQEATALLDELEEKIFSLHRKYDDEYRPSLLIRPDLPVLCITKIEDEQED